MSQRQFGGKKADSTPITGINADEALAADCDSHDSGGVWGAHSMELVRPLAPFRGSLSQVPTRRECAMSRASFNYGLFLLGIVVTASSGTRLGNIVGVTWEFAAFATGILVSAVSCAGLQTKKQIDDLEKKVTELEMARRPQA